MQSQGIGPHQRTYADRRAREVALNQFRDFTLKELAGQAQVPYWMAGKTLGQLQTIGDVERVRPGVWRVIREEVS